MLESQTMTFNPDTWISDPNARLFGIYRGVVVPGSVRTGFTAQQIVCDVYLFDHMPTLLAVPVMSAKINRSNGTSTDLEDNDIVAVQFISGNTADPVIIGCLPPAHNTVQTAQPADGPRYHLHHQGTDITIDRSGAVTISAAADITITAGTVKISGYVETDNHMSVGTGASGTIVAGGKLVTIANGIVVAVS